MPRFLTLRSISPFIACMLAVFSVATPAFAQNSEAPATAADVGTEEMTKAASETATQAAIGAVQNPPNIVGIAEPWQLNFQTPHSPVMERLYDLHNGLLWIIITVSLFVLAITLFIIIKYNRKANPTPATFTHNVRLEVIWTVIPILILVAIAVPSVRAHYMMEETPSSENAVTLKVTGNQWYWSYEYPDFGGFTFDSFMLTDEDARAAGEPRLLGVDNRVLVPVNTPVRVIMTSADVIHAWAVPALGVKRDAVPGRLNESWFTATKEGVFYGQCSELCGKLHSFMPIAVEVVSQDAFDAWVAAQQEAAGIDPAALAAEAQDAGVDNTADPGAGAASVAAPDATGVSSTVAPPDNDGTVKPTHASESATEYVVPHPNAPHDQQ